MIISRNSHSSSFVCEISGCGPESDKEAATSTAVCVLALAEGGGRSEAGCGCTVINYESSARTLTRVLVLSGRNFGCD